MKNEINTITASTEHIAACGLYCGACRKYLNGKCPGCRQNNQATWCKIRQCCQLKGYCSCAECSTDVKACKTHNNVTGKIFAFLFNSDRTACIRYIQTNGREAFAEGMTRLKAQTLKKRRSNPMKINYTDTYTATVRNARRMTATDLFRLMFVHYPKPVQYLLRLRNQLAKPFGLQAGGGFTDLIQEQNEENVVFGKQDKHLTFEVRLTCIPPDTHKQCQPIQITTSVLFHNTLGRVYFFFIRPFHCLICRSLLKRAKRLWERKSS